MHLMKGNNRNTEQLFAIIIALLGLLSCYLRNRLLTKIAQFCSTKKGENSHTEQCFQFLFGMTMVPSETKNDAYAKFWRRKQSIIIMVFLSGLIQDNDNHRQQVYSIYNNSASFSLSK